MNSQDILDSLNDFQKANIKQLIIESEQRTKLLQGAERLLLEQFNKNFRDKLVQLGEKTKTHFFQFNETSFVKFIPIFIPKHNGLIHQSDELFLVAVVRLKQVDKKFVATDVDFKHPLTFNRGGRTQFKKRLILPFDKLKAVKTSKELKAKFIKIQTVVRDNFKQEQYSNNSLLVNWVKDIVLA